MLYGIIDYKGISFLKGTTVIVGWYQWEKYSDMEHSLKVVSESYWKIRSSSSSEESRMTQFSGLSNWVCCAAFY